MSFREPLPEGCPLEVAEELVEPHDVFRLVATNPPTDADFRSQRALHPTTNYSLPECQARGLSVHTELADSVRTLKLPRFRNSKVCRVGLIPGAGYLQQTGAPSHHTWWPLAAFEILERCEVLAL